MCFPVARLMRSVALLLVAAVAAGCGDGITDAGDTGALLLVVTMIGPAPDAGGVVVQVGAFPAQTLAVPDSVVVSGLAVGPTEVALSGLAENCTLEGGMVRSVGVLPGDTVRVALEVSCTATSGTVRVWFTTVGFDLDPDGYDVVFGDAPAGHVALDDTLIISDVPSGTHTMELSGLSGNCHIEKGNRYTLTVTAGSETRLLVYVRCGYLLYGGFRLTIVSLLGDHFEEIAPVADFLYDQPAWSPDGERVVFASVA